MRFLHAADLHIDSPLRGLARYEGAPVERLRNATRGALERMVDKAIAEHVDFILLAGDIYDRDWRDFHTGLFFHEQMARLNRVGIRVFIVQGNHDAQGEISREVQLPSNVTVFSSHVAQTVCINELAVAIHGRSFPSRAVDEDLTPSYPAPVPGFFNIGMLHTSLGGRPHHDTYAPTDIATLSAKGYDYWALGHIHTREVVLEKPHIVFPGNLQGRHANETGPKGCESISVEAGKIEAEFIPLDVVRWHQLEVALDGVDRLERMGEVFRETLEPLLIDARDRLHAVRVRLTGSTRLYTIEANQPGTLDANIRATAQDLGDVEIWIEQVRLDLTTPLDRTQAIQRQDAVGELVRLVEAMSADETALRNLAEKELGDLLGKLPVEVNDNEIPKINSATDLLNLLRDAEATVLARLGAEGGAASATKIEAEQKARAKEAKSRQTDRERLQTQIIKTEGELESHLTAVQGWQPRLYLATNSTPATIKARIDDLDSLKRQAVTLAEAKSQQAQRQTVIEDFVARVQHLSMVLGDPIPEPALAEDYTDRLKSRLAVSGKQDQQRQTLIHDRQRAQDKKQKAEAEQATQTTVLEKLCAAAGIDEVNHLPECEDRAARKRQLQEFVADQHQQLAQASNRSLDELRTSLAGQDAIAIDSELGRCCTEINRLKQEQKSAHEKEQKTRQVLEAVDSSDQAAKAREAMEGAAARYRSAIKPWARLKLAHALLQKSLNQFRERAQAPMVAAASTYFALMTGGRYQRLIADETDNTPVLRAERDDGKLIAVGPATASRIALQTWRN